MTEPGRVLESRSPATGQLLGSVTATPVEAVDKIVEAARAEARGWSQLSVKERCEHLKRVRLAVVDRIDDLAATIAGETGKPLRDAYMEIGGLCLHLTWNIHNAPKVLRPKKIRAWPIITKRAWEEYSPYGVVAQLAPWNAPVGIIGQVLPSALAAGNTMVLKTSELTPLIGPQLAAVVNSAGRNLVFDISGFGEVGETIVASAVDKIAFTGSTQTGRRILQAAARRLTPTVMELGGKDAMVVDTDVDIRRAARAAVCAAYINGGQACIAAERVYVPRSIYEPFVHEAATFARTFRQGTGAWSHIGPMTNEGNIGVIENRIRAAERAGARVIVGGRRGDGPGAFYEPTVVVDVDDSMELMQEETFGPVLAIQPVDSVEDAIRLANSTSYGLNGSVFSGNRRRAAQIASRLETGGVHINDAIAGLSVLAAPFGGIKSSGSGRLQGPAGLLEFSRKKTIVADRFGQLLPPLVRFLTSPRLSPRMIRRAILIAFKRRSEIRQPRAVGAPQGRTDP